MVDLSNIINRISVKYGLSYKKVEELTKTLNINNLNNAENYLTTVVLSKFDELKIKDIECLYLVNNLKELGIEGSNEDRWFLQFACEHMVNEFPITVEELQNTITKLKNYCVDHNIKTLNEFTDLLINKTKLGKRCNVPEKEIRKKACEFVESYNKSIEELYKEEDVYGKEN